MTVEQKTAKRSDRTFFGHPRGLFYLAGTETWEYFSYYGLRTLLVLYLTKQLDYTPEAASSVYGTFSALVYVTPLLGGYLSDTFLGRRLTVVLGSTLMAIGHFCLALQAPLWIGLGAIILGSGLFLPTLPAAVNDLYEKSDRRRERAFTVYYLSVNVGAMLSPFVCGSIGERFGWNYGFVAAGVGMVIGLAIFLSGSRHLAPERKSVATLEPRPGAHGARGSVMIWLFGAAIVSMILLRGAYEQTGNTIALFAADQVDRQTQIFGHDWLIPATWFQSLNPLIVLCLTPLILTAWGRWERRGLIFSEATKMAIGCLIIAVAYAGLGAAAALAGEEKSTWGVLAGFFLVLTIGEVWVLPIGLALVGRLAPARFVSVMLAIWATSRSAGGLLAGFMGTLMPSMGAAAFFMLVALLPVLAAVILAFVARQLHTTERAVRLEAARRDENPARA